LVLAPLFFALLDTASLLRNQVNPIKAIKQRIKTKSGKQYIACITYVACVAKQATQAMQAKALKTKSKMRFNG